MEHSLKIHTDMGDYPVIITDNSFADIRNFVTGKCMIVTDSNVEPLYLDKLKATLTGIDTFSITVPAGEQSKCKERLFDIIDSLAQLDFNRTDTIIALGGGVVGDLTGLAAGLYMRGIRLVMVPTTLLSMVDSSCGGKVAVNHDMGKNMIGMFYQPVCVAINMSTLSTLEKEQIACGAAEMIKYGCIYNKDIFDLLENKNNLLLPNTIKDCINAKDYYVANDTRDKGIRMMLNFGHTIGHCVEKQTGILHGQAVAIGMYYEAVLGEYMGITKAGSGEKIKNMLIKYNLPYMMPENTDWKRFLLHDKKSGKNGITFALVKEIGQGVLVPIDYDKLKELLK
ncbi:MAG: 3-dehydroquinate synthase [Lachnospiraceae bacterium]|nr:3-dehydroquinate synthase [Lachnospiraceae bacterium]